MRSIRLSELEGKEVINLVDGARLGVIGEADMLIDIHTGEIHSIVLPQRSTFFNLWSDRQNMIIPWQTIKRIGNEVIIVELDHTVPNLIGYSG